MSGLSLVAVVAVTIWLALLSFTLVLVVRHVGLLTLRVQAGHLAEGDGLLIGERIPREAIHVAPDLDSELRYLIFLSTSCGSCRELAPHLDEVPQTSQVIACVVGEEGHRSAELAELVSRDIERISGASAKQVGDAFHIRQTPQALQVENGIITGRAMLRNIQDLQRLIAAHESSDAHEIALTMRKVFDHAG